MSRRWGDRNLEAIQEDDEPVPTCVEQSQVIQENVVDRRTDTDQLILRRQQRLSQQWTAGPTPRTGSLIGNDQDLGDR